MDNAVIFVETLETEIRNNSYRQKRKEEVLSLEEICKLAIKELEQINTF